MSSSAALTTIAVCQLIMTIAGVVAVIAIVYAILSFKKMVSAKMDEAMQKIQPVVDRAESVAQQAKETAEMVGEKVDSIMAKAETATETVTNRVQSVSGKVEEAVNPQVVAVAGMVGTAMKCVQLYKDIVQIKQGSGGNGAESK